MNGASMDRKYWVPALEKANDIIRMIADEPAKLKMADLCKRLNISKSSMFSLLQTMEALEWITQNPNNTYSMGVHYGIMGNSYFQQYDLIEAFQRLAPTTMERLVESIQLAQLNGSDVLYLAKETAPSPIQMVPVPGVRFPAHATGLGKVLLSYLKEEDLHRLYPEENLPALTPFTLHTKRELMAQIAEIRKNGYAIDLQEGVMGFNCIAAPVFPSKNELTSAVSVSMPVHNWEEKKESALREIQDLAHRLSFNR
jgi:DNA-binding IclR family transcriptional regulator